MKNTLSTSDIARALKSDENAAWSWNGARALAEYLEQLEEETGEEMELDVCAIRCDFSEYDSLEAWASDYGMQEDSLDDGREDREDNIRSFIRDNGQLIEFDGGVIVSSF
jgi:hypothetical protein